MITITKSNMDYHLRGKSFYCHIDKVEISTMIDECLPVGINDIEFRNFPDEVYVNNNPVNVQPLVEANGLMLEFNRLYQPENHLCWIIGISIGKMDLLSMRTFFVKEDNSREIEFRLWPNEVFVNKLLVHNCYFKLKHISTLGMQTVKYVNL